MLPPFIVDELELTEAQQAKIAALEKEVKAKLEKILTAKQKRLIQNARPPHKGKDDKRQGRRREGRRTRRTRTTTSGSQPRRRHPVVRDAGRRQGGGQANGPADPARLRRAALLGRVGHLVTGQTGHGQEFPVPARGDRRLPLLRLRPPGDLRGREGGRFLKGLVRTRSGELENSLPILAPVDGKKKLTPSGRSPRRHYADADELAQDLDRLAKPSPPRRPRQRSPWWRTSAWLDIAAADNLPLVILVGRDPTRESLVDKVAPLSWGKDFVGRFTFVLADSDKDLARVSGVKPKAGLLVVEPDQFGLAGKVLARRARRRLPPKSATPSARGSNRSPASRSPTGATSGQAGGRRPEIFWKTPIPVTDPEGRGRTGR